MRLTILLILLAPLTALAQSFPLDTAYVPLHCANGNAMTDDFGDDPAALNERDVVGDVNHPAGLRASDANFLYLRMRLEEDTAPGGAVTPFSWGMEFDTNNDRNNYEVLVLVSGIGGGAGSVSLFRNTTTTMPNDPNDPADMPAVQTYPYTSHGVSTVAAGTNYGGSADNFLSFAVPWADLAAAGLTRTTSTYVWVASSNSTNSLNGDFACHNPGTGGAATLDGTSSDPTPADPGQPPPSGTGRLEGGSGCAASRDHAPWLLLALLPLLRRRRR